MCQRPRPAVRDLAPDLSLVDELRLQDPVDGSCGLGVDRSPGLRVREIRSQVGAGLVGPSVATRDDDQAHRRHAHGAHATSRNSLTPRRNTSS
jgi:hypothetical protein